MLIDLVEVLVYESGAWDQLAAPPQQIIYFGSFTKGSASSFHLLTSGRLLFQTSYHFRLLVTCGRLEVAEHGFPTSC